MIVYLLDSSFDPIHIIDSFESLIWTDRYSSYGDFDIVADPTELLLGVLSDVKYVAIPESEHMMMLETHAIETDIDTGTSLILKGRSVEYILSRRVISEPTSIVGNLQDGIEDILTDHFISPTDTDRTISNFTYQASADSAITTLTADTQFLGDIYTIITDLCIANEIGYKITVNSSGQFVFLLYAGEDRSYQQSTNPHVVVSPTFDNLLAGSYIESNSLLKTHCFVLGEEGVGNIRIVKEVAAPIAPEPTGLSRCEMIFESSATRTVDGVDLTEAEYLDQLASNGLEELKKNVYIRSFDGEADTNLLTFGVDYEMGDILQVMDEYGHSTQARVMEIIYSQNLEGIKMYPTFTNIEE